MKARVERQGMERLDAMGRRPVRSRDHLALSVTVTAIVLGTPLVITWMLAMQRVLTGLLPLVTIAVLLSLAVDWLGSRCWARRAEPEDVLFSELLIWGWIRRRRMERRLGDGAALLDAGTLTVPLERRTEALARVAQAFEAQDDYLDGHSRRVARHAELLARRMGLPRQEIDRVRAAAAVHDVGKLQIPKDVLQKPAALTAEEFGVIKRHPVVGAALVDCLEDPGLTSIVRHHHERLDGAGYPDGLKGAEIPIGARIVAVADTFDAVTSARPYRPPASHREAIDILRACAGTQLDADAVETFIRSYAARRGVILWAGITSSVQGALGSSGHALALLREQAGRAAALGTTAAAAAGVAAVTAAASAPAARPERLASTAGHVTPGSAGRAAGLSAGSGPESSGSGSARVASGTGGSRAHGARAAARSRAGLNAVPATQAPASVAGATGGQPYRRFVAASSGVPRTTPPPTSAPRGTRSASPVPGAPAPRAVSRTSTPTVPTSPIAPTPLPSPTSPATATTPAPAGTPARPATTPAAATSPTPAPAAATTTAPASPSVPDPAGPDATHTNNGKHLGQTK